MLKRRGVRHEVLNAKEHEREGDIIKDAGQPQAVTVATNMAGRGVDIKLGEGVAESGGLHIIGCQRHESRRIDDQLRGRAGRQGDPGASQFFVSLDDDLLRLFGEQKMIQWALSTLNEGESIEHGMLTKAMRSAQQRVESYNFNIRKRLLDYDVVMAKQREAIYALRDRFLLGQEELDPEGVKQDFEEFMGGVLENYAEYVVSIHCEDQSRAHTWDLEALMGELDGFHHVIFEGEIREGMDFELLTEEVHNHLKANYLAQKERLGDNFVQVARLMILNMLDEHWRQHLYALDDLRDGIGWRSYQGKDPLIEFRRESFALFQGMLSQIDEQIINVLVKPELKIEVGPLEARQRNQNVRFRHDEMNAVLDNAAQQGQQQPNMQAHQGGQAAQPQPKQPRRVEKVKRNDPCPCGSGKKYKQCHGSPSAQNAES